MVFSKWFVFEYFVPNILLLLKTRTYNVVDFTVLLCVDIFHNNKFRDKHFTDWNAINLELLSVDLSYTYKCMF